MDNKSFELSFTYTGNEIQLNNYTLNINSIGLLQGQVYLKYVQYSEFNKTIVVQNGKNSIQVIKG